MNCHEAEFITAASCNHQNVHGAEKAGCILCRTDEPGIGEALKWRSDLPVCSADAGMVILLAIGLLFRLALC